MSNDTVLLVVDFLNFMDFDTAPALAPHALRAARRTRALKARLRRAGVPVIYANDDFGHWESDIGAVVETCRARGGAANALADLLEPETGDRSVLKPREDPAHEGVAAVAGLRWRPSRTEHDAGVGARRQGLPPARPRAAHPLLSLPACGAGPASGGRGALCATR